ncbi:MAG: IS630 family transposase, partial [Candidatus Aminicenantes bacterium]
LNVLTRQCFNRRIDNMEKVRSEVLAWQNYRNNKDSKVNWQFTTKDARIKLSRLYPTVDA